MCGRSVFSTTSRAQDALAVVRTGGAAPPVGKATPGMLVPGVVTSRGERILWAFYWGFGHAGDLYNARLENVLTKAVWAQVWKNRVLLPTERFAEGRGWFADPDGNVLALAGLWRHMTNGSHVTMLTRPANDVVAPYHHRMPVVVPEPLWDRWLAGHDLQDQLMEYHPPLQEAA